MCRHHATKAQERSNTHSQPWLTEASGQLCTWANMCPGTYTGQRSGRQPVASLTVLMADGCEERSSSSKRCAVGRICCGSSLIRY